MNGWGSTRRRHALLFVVVAVVAPLLGMTAAQASVSVSPVPEFPSPVTVGGSYAATLSVGNTSTPPQSGESGTISNIVLVPACTQSPFPSDNCAGGVDAGVFTLSAASTGASGCTKSTPGPITSFGISESPAGVFTFVPAGGATLVLGAGASCQISYMVTVLKVPTDLDAGTPGAQTGQRAFATIQVPSVPAGQRGSGGNLTTVNKAQPVIATAASSNAVSLGTAISDTASVTGLGGSTGLGTVTFTLFGNSTCTVQAGSSTVALTSTGATTGIATSSPVTPSAPGTYHWVATYNGDANSNPAGPTACVDPAEQVVINKANPTIVTTASQSTAAINASVTDNATVTGLVSPVTGAGAGTVTFRLFSDNACNVLISTSANRPLTLNAGNTQGTATSDPIVVTTAGTYHWVATYSGDANNNAAGPTACLDPAEQLVVAKATPAIATAATPQSTVVGSTLQDTAQVSGRANPSGSETITFRLFSDAACSNQVFQSTNAVGQATGSASSGAFTATAPGAYHWVASYSGDANNNAAGPTACADPAEQAVVGKANPAIATTATPTVPLGQPVFDVATVVGGVNPTGNIVFTLFNDAICTAAGQVFTSTNALNQATGKATSGQFTPTVPGTYHWVAIYSGDANNNAAGPTACADPAEQVVVTKANPTIATTASAGVPVGGTVTDTATVAGGFNPSGTVTFTLYSDSACTTSVFSSSNPLNTVTRTATSGGFVTTAPGTYRWVAVYNGDSNNSPAGPTVCNDPAETVTVTAPPGGTFTPVGPVRIEDSRFGVGSLNGPLGPGATANVQVTGRAGVPASATAVVFNLTVTQPTADGYVTVYPTGSPVPTSSNVNFTAGKTVPNLVAVKLGTGGQVALYNPAGFTHVILDVTGYFSDTVGNAGRFQPLVPARIGDTRFGLGGVTLGAGQSIDVQVTGAGGAPATGVLAAVLNVAATNTTAASFLTVYPTGDPRPNSSSVNFGPGDTVSNRVMTRVGTGGKVTIYNASGSTDVVVDLNGTYTDASVAGTLGTYTPVEPARALDTRTGLGGGIGVVPAGGTVDVQVTGVAGVPATGVRAVILNVTVTQPATAGFLTLFPKGATRPNASDVNYATNETRANQVVVQVGTNGKVSLYTWAATHAIVDIAGYFT